MLAPTMREASVPVAARAASLKFGPGNAWINGGARRKFLGETHQPSYRCDRLREEDLSHFQS